MDEVVLLKEIRTNPEKFSELFEIYYKAIFGYIMRRTGSFDDSADIAADTFLKAFRNIKNFKHTGISVKVWLYRIATNEVNQYFRYRKKYDSIFNRISSEDNAAFNSFLSDDRKEVETEMQRHEMYLEVLKQLKTLHVKYQEVIALRYFEGKDNKEISEILGINDGTLKSLLSRGLEKLRQKCNQI
jgi:RNA polymerase sigma-70 factor, ECF subfamily